MKRVGEANHEADSQTSLNLPSIEAVNDGDKKARKEIEKKRKLLELTVSSLRRKAEATAKQLSQTQTDLMDAYHKKLSTLDHNSRVDQARRDKQEELSKLRNLSNLSRYLHQTRKRETVEALAAHRKQTIQTMKNYLEETGNRNKREQQHQHQQMTERNRKMSQTNRRNVQWARSRSLRQKVKVSELVRNELKSIEKSRIQDEKQRIQELEDEQRIILEMLDRSRKKNGEAQSIKEQLWKMDLFEFQERVRKNEESRVTVATRRLQKKKKKKEKDIQFFYF